MAVTETGLELALDGLSEAEAGGDAGSPAAPAAAGGGVLAGRLVRLGADGVPWVACALANAPVPADTTVPLGAAHVGRTVILAVADGADRPVVLGCVAGPSARATATAAVDGERIEFTAQREIVLRCGKASITLTRSGKVLIRGEYVLSRSAGVNQVQGGAVHIN